MQTTWLVAYDFSPLAHMALSTAARMLSAQGGGHLVVVHVHQLHTGIDGAGLDLATFGTSDLERAYVADAEQQLTSELATVTEPGVTIEQRIVQGRPATALCKTAQDLGAALIVIGSHGRTGLERLFIGSVAEAVLRHSPCPVLVIKQPAAKT